MEGEREEGRERKGRERRVTRREKEGRERIVIKENRKKSNGERDWGEVNDRRRGGKEVSQPNVFTPSSLWLCFYRS